MPVNPQNGAMGQSGMQPLSQRMNEKEKEAEELEQEAEKELEKIRVANQVTYEQKITEGKKRARVSDAMLRQLDHAARESEKETTKILEVQVPPPRPAEEIEQERRNRLAFDAQTAHLTEDQFIEKAAKKGWVFDEDARVLRQIYKDARSTANPEMIELVRKIQETDVSTAAARESFIGKMYERSLQGHLLEEVGTLRVEVSSEEIQERMTEYREKHIKQQEAAKDPEPMQALYEEKDAEPFRKNSSYASVYRQKAEKLRDVYAASLEDAQAEAFSPAEAEHLLYRNEALHSALHETIIARTIGKKAEEEQWQISGEQMEQRVAEGLPDFRQRSGKTIEHMIKTEGFGKIVNAALTHDGSELMHMLAHAERRRGIEEKTVAKPEDRVLQKTLKAEKTL